MKKLISLIIAGLLAISIMPSVSASALSKTYYLFGYINMKNYACEEDYQNMGEYRFDENGKLVVQFNEVSYVAVKEENNAEWYMTDGWQGDVDSVRLLSTSITGETSDKLKIPAQVPVILTLTENGDGTLTLSYSLDDELSYPIRTRLWDYVNMEIPANIIAPGNYWSEESLKPFNEALSEANAALDNLDSTDEELKSAYDKLYKAAQELEKADGAYWSRKLQDKLKEVPVDFSHSEDYYYQFYTKESFDNFYKVFVYASDLFTYDENEFKVAYFKLCDAIEQLVEVAPIPTTEAVEPTTVTEKPTSAIPIETEDHLESMPIPIDDTTVEYWQEYLRGLVSECSVDFEREPEYYYQFYTKQSYDDYRQAYQIAKSTYSGSIETLKYTCNRLKYTKTHLVKAGEETTATQKPTETKITKPTEPKTTSTEPVTYIPDVTYTVEPSETVKASDPSETATVTKPAETTEPTEPTTTETPAETEQLTTETQEQTTETVTETAQITTETTEPAVKTQPQPKPIVKKTTVKKANPIKVTVRKKTISSKKLRKKKLSFKIFTIKNAKGKLTYTKLSGSKRFKLNRTTGVITALKGTKKSLYKLKIRIYAKGNSKYKPKKIIKTVKIRVK